MNNGTNSARMRRTNEKSILSLIQRVPMSRAEIAKTMGLTKAAVTIIVDDLISRGWITEREGSAVGVGRKPLLLSFCGSSLPALGINVTRTAVIVGVCDFDGRVLWERSFPACSAEEFFDRLNGILQAVQSESGILLSALQGLGIVTPGPIDPVKDCVLGAPNFRGWDGVSVTGEMRRHFSGKITYTNVSRGVAVAEKYYGAAKTSGDFAVLLVNRDGIGSGLILDGRLYRGNNEIGHTSIAFDGPLCSCGHRGCLELYASLSAIVAGSPYRCWEDAVDAGDRPLLEREADYLAAAVLNLSNSFDIDRVLLCGDVCYGGAALVRILRERTMGKALCRRTLDISLGTPLHASLIAVSPLVHDFFCGAEE